MAIISSPLRGNTKEMPAKLAKEDKRIVRACQGFEVRGGPLPQALWNANLRDPALVHSTKPFSSLTQFLQHSPTYFLQRCLWNPSLGQTAGRRCDTNCRACSKARFLNPAGVLQGLWWQETPHTTYPWTA